MFVLKASVWLAAIEQFAPAILQATRTSWAERVALLRIGHEGDGCQDILLRAQPLACTMCTRSDQEQGGMYIFARRHKYRYAIGHVHRFEF